MAELTPEEREKIYLEEKARLEVRRELEGEKASTGSVIGWIVLCVFGLLFILWIAGTNMQHEKDAEFAKLTPAQRHAKTLQNCASLLKDWEYKTYSELSVTERQAKEACTEQLLHPDQEIIRPSQ
jgi:hypothetical protein